MRKVVGIGISVALTMSMMFVSCKNSDEVNVAESANANKNMVTSEKSVEEVTASMSETSGDIKAGVWLASSENQYQSYYFFNEDGNTGTIASLSNGEKDNFIYSVNGNKSTFEIKQSDGTENETKQATIVKSGENDITIKWEDDKEDVLYYLNDKSEKEFKFYSDNELAKMALKYYSKENDGYTPSSCGTETNEDGTVVIQLYDNLEDHNSTCAWYVVDRTTGKGIDQISSEEIDIVEK